MTFGEKLQALRKARGWSQEELATQINVSRQALSKWESGASVPDTENVVALSRLFGVSTDYLLLDKGETAAAPVTAVSAVKKWPAMRRVWLTVFLISVVGKLAIRLWASILSAHTIFIGDGPRPTDMQHLARCYHLGWLILLLWGLLIVGFVGTVFYKQMREFFAGGWLK